MSQLSNPKSTGGIGHHFENHVQACYLTLMLTGGCAPVLPSLPITEIKLQGKVDGYDTDDLIVKVKNSSSNKEIKLLAQVKHSISFTQGSQALSEVLTNAWNDYNNQVVFTKHIDKLALITGPINKTDFNNVIWLLDYAKTTSNEIDFFKNVTKSNFSPSKSEKKLNVIKYHLKIANKNIDISDKDFYNFLKHFHYIGFDLGKEIGVSLSLLHSHISQFQSTNIEFIWARIVEIVQNFNQNAGTITLENLPSDIIDVFKSKEKSEIPKEYVTPKTDKIITEIKHSNETEKILTIAGLLGAWNGKNQNDQRIVDRIVNGF